MNSQEEGQKVCHLLRKTLPQAAMILVRAVIPEDLIA
jgi:hypothetical protein